MCNYFPYKKDVQTPKCFLFILPRLKIRNCRKRWSCRIQVLADKKLIKKIKSQANEKQESTNENSKSWLLEKRFEGKPEY